MCEHDGTFRSQTTVRLAHPRSDGAATAGVDPCIAPIVQALNDAGIQTLASCCGHGHRPGSIILEDGREILIARSRDEARCMDAGFPDIHGESTYLTALGSKRT